jgi:photosystem I subunit 3
MRRFFALALSALLVFGFAPVAKADVAGLTPGSESARFQCCHHASGQSPF